MTKYKRKVLYFSSVCSVMLNFICFVNCNENVWILVENKHRSKYFGISILSKVVLQSFDIFEAKKGIELKQYEGEDNW